MAFKDDVQAVIDGIKAGQIMETFERYYADDVVMIENGEPPRVGKDANRDFEQAFIDGYDFFGAEVGRVVLDEPNQQAAVEWEFEMAPKGGERVKVKQVAVQSWRDGQIGKESFYYDKG